MERAFENPFKGLQPYGQSDKEKLFGRDRDLVLVKDRIFSARSTLLFAGSGVGKTSFLNAKVIPEFKRSHFVFYHNEWSGKDSPLHAVKKQLVQQSKFDQNACDQSLPSIVKDINESHTHSLAGNYAREPEPQAWNRSLLILDQFEELFQYHAYEGYFQDFLDELCDAINDDSLSVRVVFSMREEFLGELSVFDNRIPDLFNSYYHLKYPDRHEAEDIIRRTCGLVDTSVDDQVSQLVRDLSKIEKGAASFGESSIEGNKAKTRIVERDFVVPPYLQIACQRLWSKQFAQDHDGKPAGAAFLSGYKADEAQAMLQAFCNEKLSSLSFWERRLAAQSFGFLITRQGAKMAYELTRLSEHMGVSQKRLKRTLAKLSSPDTRILRVSRGPDGSHWFELYHDMYGTIVDRWRHSFQRKLRTWSISGLVGTSALVIILFLAVPYWILNPRSYKHILRSPEVTYVEAKPAYEKLRGIFGYQTTADKLWAEFWRRRASTAASQQSHDDALFFTLEALAAERDAKAAWASRIEAGYLVDPAYGALLATYRQEGVYPKAIFSTDSQFLLTNALTKNGELTVRVWDADTGEPKTLPVNLELYKPNETVSKADTKGHSKGRNQRPSRAAETKASEIQEGGPALASLANHLTVLAVTQHPQARFLIAGINTSQQNNKTNLFLWRADTGRLFSEAAAPWSNLSSIRYVEFSPDNQYIGVLTKDGVSVWRLTDNSLVLKDESMRIWAFAFSPDSKTLITSGPKICLWNVQTARRLAPPLLADVNGKVIFSNDGKLFAVLGHGSVQVWETGLGKRIQSLPVDTFSLAGIAFGPNDKTVIVGSRSNDLEVWDTVSGDRIGTTRGIVSLTYSAFPRGRLIFRPDGKAVLTMADDGAARLLSLDRLLETGLGDNVYGLSMTSDGATVATINGSRAVQVWGYDFHSDTVRLVNSFGDKMANARSVALSADGQFVATVDEDGVARVRETASNRETAQLLSLDPLRSLGGALRLSPDGKFLAAWSYFSDEIRLWDVANSTLKKSISTRGFAVTLGFSPDGNYLIVTGTIENRGVPHVFHLPEAREITMNSQDLHGTISATKATSDGRLIGTGSYSTACIWDLASGQLLKVLTHSSGVDSLAISPNNKLLVTATSDNAAHLWDLESGTELIALSPLPDRIWQFAFSRDNGTVMIFADQWVHRYLIDGQTLRYAGSRLLGFRLGLYQADDAGTKLRFVSRLQGENLEFDYIRFDNSDGSKAIGGDPNQLLSDWQKRLALKLSDSGEVVPAWRVDTGN